MRAVVLVGGYGTRLRPLTTSTPKQMLPVVGRPMIEWVLDHLGRHGLEDAVLSLGYRPDAFTRAYPEGVCAGVGLEYAVEPEPLDTAGAIRFAARQAGLDETFVVVNGDVLTDSDLTALVDAHRRWGAEATISLTRVDDPSRYGVVPTDPSGRVVAFVEKPPPGEAPTDLINAGAYVLEPSVLDRIADGRRVSIERDTFPALAAEGTLFAVPSPAYWIDAGTPEAYLQCQLDLLDGVRAHPFVPPPAAASLLGDVGLPVHVGRDVVVEAGALVRRSVLGDGSRVEAGAEVTDAVLLPGAVVGEGATVRRSIVGPSAVVGPGAALDHLSVVGDHARVDADAVVRGARIPESEAD